MTRPARGFTLVELLVALLLSLVVAVVLLKMQSKFGQHIVRSSDVAVRDTQSRAAMDLITRDLSGAGFLFGGTQTFCNALLAYNSAAPGGGYSVRHPIDAVAASYGQTLKFAPSLTLNYPPEGSLVASDVLVVAGSAASVNFNDSTYPIVNVSPDASYAPMTTGVVPLANGSGFASGDVGILQVPVAGKRACLRVPLAVAGNVVTSVGALMPSAFYAGFATQTTAMGMTDALTNAEIFQSRLANMGPTATPAQTSTVFYVDRGNGAFPMLMRATYSLLDDAVVGQPQAIAAGVVSLQVRFGVDPGGTGAVTAYQSAADVTANKYWDFVRSVKVALVTRTLNDDAGYATGTLTLDSSFAALPSLAGAAQRHLAEQTEIASRNLLWK